MRLRLAVLSVVAVLGLSGAVIGPSGALLDRSMKPLGGALRANADDAVDAYAAAVSIAFLNYSAEDVSGTDGVQETSWANTGTGGATWDLDSAYSGGLTYQQAGDCSYSDKPCLVSDATGADRLAMSTNSVRAWTTQYHCLVGYMPGSSIARMAHLNFALASRNMWGSNGTSGVLYVAHGTAATTAPSPRATSLFASCIDMTDNTAATIATNGTESAVVDISGSLYRDTDRIMLGGRLDGSLPCVNCEVHQFILWDTAPGYTPLEMSQILYDHWAN